MILLNKFNNKPKIQAEYILKLNVKVVFRKSI
jgi:hypothetical protein